MEDPAPRTAGFNFPVIASVIVLAAFTAVGGGYVSGLAISEFGRLGSALLWPVGVVAGWLGRKVVGKPNTPASIILSTACVLALILAEVCWLHWHTVQGAEGWLAAVQLLPTFVVEYRIPALIAALFTGFGAWSAYRQVATDR